MPQISSFLNTFQNAAHLIQSMHVAWYEYMKRYFIYSKLHFCLALKAFESQPISSNMETNEQAAHRMQTPSSIGFNVELPKARDNIANRQLGRFRRKKNN